MVQFSGWEVVSFFINLEKWFGLSALVISLCLNWYILMWSFKGWGLLNFDPWFNDIVFFLDSEGGESLIFLTMAEDMLDSVKQLVMTDF